MIHVCKRFNIQREFSYEYLLKETYSHSTHHTTPCMITSGCITKWAVAVMPWHFKEIRRMHIWQKNMDERGDDDYLPPTIQMHPHRSSSPPATFTHKSDRKSFCTFVFWPRHTADMPIRWNNENPYISKNVGRDHTRHTSCYFKQEDGKHQSTLWVGDKHQKCREVL